MSDELAAVDNGPSPEDIFGGRAEPETLAAARPTASPGEEAISIVREAIENDSRLNVDDLKDLLALLTGDLG